jgi:Asp-tRNA(Asn)/Glu-tRNA(Gln) amidotransferase A subunit family amidase
LAPNDLTAAQALAKLSSRELSAEAMARACLAHIAEREPVVHAFAHLDPEHVLAQARALDRGAVRGPLHGLPLGVKDVIDTYDAPTEYGSPIYRGHRPAADAGCVALARSLGALILGKTVSTEFATFPPGPTANPRNPAHTPGGSSSGSAAAVADCMLPLAFGTQTSGSVIRPAAFCGVVGYKPSFGTLPRNGVKLLADSLDTVGLFACNAEDAALLIFALTGRAGLPIGHTVQAPRLAVCRTPQWPAAQPETVALFDDLPGRLVRAGAYVGKLELPASFAGLEAAQNTVWEYEMARNLADEYHRHAARIREPLRGQLAAGWKIPPERYDAAKALARDCRRQLADVFADYDALIVPSAPGEAPKGLEATGNPVFNRIWTMLHVPAVTVPYATGPNGLPLGVQVIGRVGDDARALACAHWLQASGQPAV